MSEARQRRSEGLGAFAEIFNDLRKVFLLEKLLYTVHSVKDRRRTSRGMRKTSAERVGKGKYRSYKLRYAWSWQEGLCG